MLAVYRADAVTLHLVQTGDVAYGRLVLDGATAAESVPVAVRNAGLWGIGVRAKVSRDKVTLRHEAGGHLFTADLKLAGDGEYLYGLVRGPHPNVTIVVTRAPEAAPPPPQAAMATPAPALRHVETPQKAEPSAKVVVIGPAQKEPDAPVPPTDGVRRRGTGIAIHSFDKADSVSTRWTRSGSCRVAEDHADALSIEGHCDDAAGRVQRGLGEAASQVVASFCQRRHLLRPLSRQPRPGTPDRLRAQDAECRTPAEFRVNIDSSFRAATNQTGVAPLPLTTECRRPGSVSSRITATPSCPHMISSISTERSRERLRSRPPSAMHPASPPASAAGPRRRR